MVLGDVLKVLPGEAFPADGVIVRGHTQADEALLTGESRPVSKQEGCAVVAGSFNLSAMVEMQVQALGESTRFAEIVGLMEQASTQKPRLAQLADKVAGPFLLGILLLAAATAAYWWPHDPGKGLLYAAVVLIVTCPCALSLATPAALTAATGNLAGKGLLLTRGHALETLAKVTDVVFDKTGTLTYGSLRHLATLPLNAQSEAEGLALAAALESSASHPIAQALLAASPAPHGHAEAVHATAGAGVEGTVNGRRYRLGTPRFVAEWAGAVPAALVDWQAGATVVALGDETGWMAAFALGDTVREEAAALMTQLHRLGQIGRAHV